MPQKIVRIALKTVLCLLDLAVIAGGIYFLRRGALQTEWLTTTDTEALIYGGILGFLGLCLMASGVASLQSKFDWLWSRFKATRAEFEHSATAALQTSAPAPALTAAAAPAAPVAPAAPTEEPTPKQTV